jgi:hypothetical protein
MSEEDYDILVPCTPPELKNIINCAVPILCLKNLNVSMKKCYSDFRDWCNKKNVKTVWENVVLVYLLEKSKILKSSSLRSRYSMLKLQLNIRDGIDVTKFLKLIPLKKKTKQLGIKRKSLKASDENY